MWKGDVHEDMYVTTPPTGGSCGFTFTEGEEFILYAHDSPYEDGGYTVSICSRTALLSQAQADIEAFGEGDAPRSGLTGPKPEANAGQRERHVGNHARGCRGGTPAGPALGDRVGEAPVAQSETTLVPACRRPSVPAKRPSIPQHRLLRSADGCQRYPLPYLGAPQFWGGLPPH